MPPKAAAPPLPSATKVKEAKGKMMYKKSSSILLANEGRSNAKQMREQWGSTLKKSNKGKGKGKGKNAKKGKGRGKGKYQVKKDGESVREEAIANLEKKLDKKRHTSLKEMHKQEKGERLKKPNFGVVSKVVPEAKNVNLMVKCVKCNPVEGNSKLWEAVCGDETGTVTISVQSKEQAELCKPGASLRVQNAKVIMVKGYIRVAIDKWAVIKTADKPLEFNVNSALDISATEYELAEE